MTYIFFLVFFVLSGLYTALTGGLIGDASETNAVINSAASITEMLNSLNTDLIGIIILITIIAQFDLIGQLAKETIRENFLKGGWGMLIAKTGILIIIIAIIYMALKIIFKK